MDPRKNPDPVLCGGETAAAKEPAETSLFLKSVVRLSKSHGQPRVSLLSQPDWCALSVSFSRLIEFIFHT